MVASQDAQATARAILARGLCPQSRRAQAGVWNEISALAQRRATAGGSAVLWLLWIAEWAVLRRLRRTFKVESVYASRDAFCGADAEPLSLQWSVRSG